MPRRFPRLPFTCCSWPPLSRSRPRPVASRSFSRRALIRLTAPAILANGTLYVSGQGSSARDFTGQASEAMHKVQTVLRAAGMDFENVVWMNVYLTDTHDQAALEDVYWKMIGSSPPARTVLTVAALPNGEKVEINCIAVADAGERKAIWPAGWPRGPHRRSACDRGWGNARTCRRKAERIR